MLKTILKLGFLFIALISTVSVFAQDDEKNPVEISGFVDGYYQFNFNENAPGLTSFTETHNSFTLGMANVVFSQELDKVGFVADLAFGPRAEGANGFNGTSLASIKQLYVTYSPTDKLTFSLGNYGTHVGYELIDANGNFNYSTSYLFSYGPFYHTGIKADYAITDEIGFMVGVFDDTDSKFDFEDGKHIGAQLSYANDKVGAYLNYIGGNESGDTITGQQIDLTATFQATDDFLIGLNATNKTLVLDGTDNVSWAGAALYLNYAVSDAFGLGVRGEMLSDADGAIFGVSDLSIIDFTLSANYTVGNLTFIPEFRIDSASEDIFVDADGNATGTSPRVLLAFVYSF